MIASAGDFLNDLPILTGIIWLLPYRLPMPSKSSKLSMMRVQGEMSPPLHTCPPQHSHVHKG